MKYLLLLIYLCLCVCDSFSQGLQFKDNTSQIEDRTSYNVFSDNPPVFRHKLSINFDMFMYKFNDFGNILRIKDVNEKSIFNLTCVHEEKGNNQLTIKFNEEGRNNLISFSVDNQLVNNEKWFPITIHLDFDEKTGYIEVAGKRSEFSKLNVSPQFKANIYFGKDEHIIDVASFAIKNLSIKDTNKTYQFSLDESEGEDVHNVGGKIMGNVSNPIWLMNKSFLWNTDLEYTSPFFGWINFDQQKQKFIFLDEDSISYYNVLNNHLTTFAYQNKILIQNQLGMSFIDSVHNRLYTYEVNNPPRNSPTVAYMDMDSLRWNAVSDKHLSMQRHHHNGFMDYQKNRYIIFGGFGNKKYSNSFSSFDYMENRWDTLHFIGDTISPRYFSGMAYHPQQNVLYILGGMGNPTGDQTLGRTYFYDLHQVDLSTQTITKLWEIPWGESNVVIARNMLLLDDSSIYALCYPEHITSSNLQLYKFSIADGSYQTYGDQIPMQSEKIETNANLYYSDVVKKIYCVVQELSNTQSKVSLYSLTYPPSTKEGLNRYGAKSSTNYLYLLLIPVLIVGLLFLIMYVKKKNAQHAIINPASIYGYFVVSLEDGKRRL